MIKKISFQDPNAPASPASGPTTAPAAAPTPDHTTVPAATSAPAASPTKTPSKRDTKYYSYSLSTEKMQNKMRYLANLINMVMPQLIQGSDKYDQNVAKKFNIDQNLINKIKEISKRITKEGVPGGDGLWGPKTQEALNSIQDFAKTIVSAVRPDDPSYQQFLDNMAIVAAPGKSFGGIKSSEVPANAEQMTEKLDKIADLVQEFGEHLKKVPAAPAVSTVNKDQSTQPGQTDQTAQNPNQQVNQQPDQEGQQEDQTSPAGSAQQPGQQAKSQQSGLNQNILQIQDSLEQTSQTGKLIFPFDTATDVISFDRFSTFLMQTNDLILKPAFIAEMGTYYAVLRNALGQLGTSILSWQQVAKGADGVDGGFTLTVNDDVNSFVKDYASNDYTKARNMLNVLSTICLGLANVVRSLSASSSLVSLMGKDGFDLQYRRGLDYVARIKNMIAQIDRNVARK